VNAANPAPYLRDGTSEWLHFRVIAAAMPRVKTTHVLFRSRLPLLRYASFKYTHFLMREVGPFLISAHIYIVRGCGFTSSQPARQTVSCAWLLSLVKLPSGIDTAHLNPAIYISREIQRYGLSSRLMITHLYSPAS
jgi:hypothetical protein